MLSPYEPDIFGHIFFGEKYQEIKNRNIPSIQLLHRDPILAIETDYFELDGKVMN
jgi:hypothetical protein